MTSPSDLYEQALAWLRRNYTVYRFFVERDIVWTVQTYLQRRIDEDNLNYRLYNDYPMLPGRRRSLSTDLAILNAANVVEIAVEFKYEPSHTREDILRQKFPVVSWGADGVGKDVWRIREYVMQRKAKAAYSILIDECGYFHVNAPHPGSEWQVWEGGVWVLVAHVQATHGSE